MADSVDSELDGMSSKSVARARRASGSLCVRGAAAHVRVCVRDVKALAENGGAAVTRAGA